MVAGQPAGEEAAREELARIAANAAAFLASLVDIKATGSPITQTLRPFTASKCGIRFWLTGTCQTSAVLMAGEEGCASKPRAEKTRNDSIHQFDLRSPARRVLTIHMSRIVTARPRWPSSKASP